jgi:iron complex outermembrane receptor protein
MLAITISGYSQFTLSGRITDAGGKPLAGADVYLADLLQATITLTDGTYFLKKVPRGSHTLTVSYLGFEKEARAIDVTGDLTIDFALTEQNYLADEIAVYGTRARERHPMAFSNINREEISKVNTGDDITYMLASSPSLVVTSEAGIGLGYTSLRIRGSDQTRINVTVDGIPLNDAESQGVFWVNMPDFASSVDNVQIQRGVGTSTQGAGAFGATINFQTLGLSPEPYGEYQLVAGSFNTFRNSIRLGSGLIGDHFSFDMRLSKLNTDGYIRHSFSDHGSIYFTGAYHAKNTLIRFTFLDGHERTGISWWGVPAEVIDIDRRYNPAGVFFDTTGMEHYYEEQTDNYRQSHYQAHFSHKLNKQFDFTLAGHYTLGAGYYEQYMDDANSYHSSAYADYGLPGAVIINGDTLTQSDMIRRKWLDNDFYGFTATLNFRTSRVEASIGGGWNNYDGDHFGRIMWVEKNNGIPRDYQWYLNSSQKGDWNLYLKTSYLITVRATLFGDLQVRNISYTMEGVDDDLLALEQEHKYNFFNPKFGINYKLATHSNAYASFAMANREPTRANFKEAKGDPNAIPLPERLYDVEAGYFFAIPRFTAGINLYYMLYQDQLVPTGEKSNVGYDIMTNVADSYRRGIELVTVLKPADRIQWDLNVTLSQNKIRNFVEYATHYSGWNEDWQWYLNEEHLGTSLGETNIAYSPGITGSSVLTFKPIRNGEAALISKYVGKQYFDNTSSPDRKIDPYFINDIRLSYSIPVKGLKDISLSLQINNLFNTLYISNAYGGNWYEAGEELTWAYFYPQAGIHFYSGLLLKF